VAESIPEQIAAALRSRFLAITADGGTTYWYKPDAVLVAEMTETVLTGAGGARTIYVLDPRSCSVVEESNLSLRGELELHLIVLYDMRLATIDPWATATTHDRFLLESRMVRDAIRCLQADVTLGAITINTNASSIDVEYGLHIEAEKWACAALTFSVSYSCDKGAP
jgi:hypothetical protein